jgi:hypothetical protein
LGVDKYYGSLKAEHGIPVAALLAASPSFSRNAARQMHFPHPDYQTGHHKASHDHLEQNVHNR